MALEGTLQDFGVGEILQLIGTQQKTGILFVEGTGEIEEVQIYFRTGKVIRVDAARRDKRDPIGQMMSAATAITKDQLATAVAVQKKTLQRVGDILLEQEAVTADLLTEFVELYAKETLYRLFQWKKGSYRFETKTPNFARPNMTPLSSESLLMDGVRMMDEWPLIQTRISSGEIVFKAIRTIAESETAAEALDRILDDAFSEFIDPAAAAKPQEPVKSKKATGAVSNLTRTDRRVFAYVDGRRPVTTVIDLSRVGEFEACKSLVALLNEGYIAPVKVTAARAGEPLRRRIDWAGWAVQILLNAAVIGVLVLAVVFMPRTRAESANQAEELAVGAIARLRQNRVTVTAAALNVYRLRDGKFPESLDPLIDAGLVTRDVLDPPGQPPLIYLSIGTDFDLR